ncbi:MAG: gamma-glutamyl-phosphate reductase, partial [Prochlorococcus sp.]|nr:gamma-glutamyl-phosphate reductase [Prochlorococcus sp.]
MSISAGVPEPSPELLKRAMQLRAAAMQLGQTDNEQRRSALMAMAMSLQASAEKIVQANGQDLENARTEGLASALMARLKLDQAKLASA